MPKMTKADKSWAEFQAKRTAWRNRFPDGPDIGGIDTTCETKENDITWVIDVIEPDIDCKRFYHTTSELLMSDFPEYGDSIKLDGYVLTRAASFIMEQAAWSGFRKNGNARQSVSSAFVISRLGDNTQGPVTIRCNGVYAFSLREERIEFHPPYPKRWQRF